MMLVDIDTCKLRLRIDQDVEDDDIELLIKGASGAVMNYLKLDHDFYDDSSGNSQGVPDEVINATIVLVGILGKTREGEAGIINPQWTMGYLPAVVVSLLYPLRDPAVA